MNFKIFRNFSGIFLILFKFIFDFFIFKFIKKMQKNVGYWGAGPRRCHVAARDGLRGKRR